MKLGEARKTEDLERAVAEFNQVFTSIEKEVGRVIVGMGEVVSSTVACVFAGGHTLLEGVPGLGKTLLVKSIARALGLDFKRIQFTPDLMPSDVTGTQVLSENSEGGRRFEFKAGPIFSNVVLADEINRATPKTQAALLEAMEERQVTVLGVTYPLAQPFFVLATQNPIELEGTYPLPEAQLDRFLVKLLVAPPSSGELKEILRRTTGVQIPEAKSVFEGDDVGAVMQRLKQLVRQVIVADPMQEILVRMMSALTPASNFATERTKRYVRFGPGPRGAQAIMMLGKVSALRDMRINLSFDDIRRAMLPAIRHRLILNFQAEADGVTADDIVEEVKNVK